jgi:hypothetical protein
MKTAQGYPAMAMMYEFNFITNTNITHGFDSYEDAQDYYRAHNSDRVHFSPIFTVEVTR